jgi:hypothetical protein
MQGLRVLFTLQILAADFSKCAGLYISHVVTFFLCSCEYMVGPYMQAPNYIIIIKPIVNILP